jgi:regulator of protease activity HflC (stomatin/prohibitin superfamily)
VGPDYVDKLILPELHSAVANITSEYNARALYTDARAQLTRELRQYLQDKLGHKGIVIEDVLLRAIKLPEQLTKAIQDKLRTEQVRRSFFDWDLVGIMLSVGLDCSIPDCFVCRNLLIVNYG